MLGCFWPYLSDNIHILELRPGTYVGEPLVFCGVYMGVYINSVYVCEPLVFVDV